MNRRSFLKALLAAPAACLVPWQKLIAPTPPPLGISLRFVRAYDITCGPVNRMDVLYGTGTLRGEFAALVNGPSHQGWQYHPEAAAIFDEAPCECLDCDGGPETALPVRQDLKFHPDAISMVWE